MSNLEPPSLLSRDEKRLLEQVAQISYCNPFSLARSELEKSILGEQFKSESETWNGSFSPVEDLSNIMAIFSLVKPVLEKLRRSIADSPESSLRAEVREQYVDVCLFVLYHSYQQQLREYVQSKLLRARSDINQQIALELKAPPKLYLSFNADCHHWFSVHSIFQTSEYEPAHLFALAFQVSRAFCSIFHFLIGVSDAMRRLRERLWESIFTHDMRRYRRSLYLRMGEHSTLISGPSGSGKELVARAIGLSRYISFNIRKNGFDEDFSQSFYALNLAAIPATLIESELFGHTRGAYTGANTERKGWLEHCGPLGTVFLDEIAEIDQTIQVKLLRVLESRQFQRMGDTKTLQFQGKIVAATNRDLDHEVSQGNFRQDLYYRLCADEIHTPGLAERLLDNSLELEILVNFLLRRWSNDLEGERSAPELLQWIKSHIPGNYSWPGNVRELDQCLRNLIIHGEYLPLTGNNQAPSAVLPSTLQSRISNLEASVDEVIRWYCQYAYQKLGNFEEVGRRIKLDRRTVKAKAYD